jgi:Cu(I)/Ag(I) efflux system membrane fusion protein
MGGLLLGYLIFGDSSDPIAVDNEIQTNGRWTCSMHPQIDGKEHEKCPLCAMDLVYLESAESTLSDNQFEMTESALALANVQTTKIDLNVDSTMAIRLSGEITTNAETDAVQTTLYEGRLDELYPNYVGKKVWKGQEIGKIYSPELYLAQDKLLTSISYRETHPKLYDAARYTLGLWKMTDEQIEQMLKSGKPMMNFPLYSDVSGTVTEVIAKEGDYYKEGTPIFKVSDLNTVWAVFDAYEEQLPLLKVGQQVEISMTAVPNEKLKGKITFIEPILNNEKRTAVVRVVLKNHSGKIKPGMFAEATVHSNLPENMNYVTVPESAVLWTGKRSVVYIKPFSKQPIFELTEVDLGQHLDNSYVVLDGLSRGDEVVTQGAFTVDAAAQLMGKNSMMNRRRANDDLKETPLKTIKDNKEAQPLHISEVDKINIFLSNYFELKDALVGTDFELTQAKLLKLKEGMTEILQTPAMVSESWELLNTSLQPMVSAKDIEGVRKYFKPFSEGMVDLARDLNGYKNTIYVQFCPMADNNKGAFWLSLQEEIRNPYFGDKMLICGVVKEQLN